LNSRLPVLHSIHTMAKTKKGANKKKEAARQVPLARRLILDGHCEFLAPSPITNSGRADGGWMDRIGISAAGLGHLFGDALNPIDCFYSNDAYAKAGFSTILLELHPPLDVIGDASTIENLTSYLKSYCLGTENDFYLRGAYRSIPDDEVAPVIADPSTIGSPASMIVQTAFEVPITPPTDANTDIPQGLTATTYVALVHFAGKGNVLFKANNFERHAPPLDYEKMLASISYKTKRAAYRGEDPSLSGLRGMSALMSSGGDINHVKSTMARAQAEAGTTTKYCHKCGADHAPDGGRLLQCGKCKASSYCSRECQTADWKRHKREECIARDA
jgi:hypothetical protein